MELRPLPIYPYPYSSNALVWQIPQPLHSAKPLPAHLSLSRSGLDPCLRLSFLSPYVPPYVPPSSPPDPSGYPCREVHTHAAANFVGETKSAKSALTVHTKWENKVQTECSACVPYIYTHTHIHTHTYAYTHTYTHIPACARAQVHKQTLCASPHNTHPPVFYMLRVLNHALDSVHHICEPQCVTCCISSINLRLDALSDVCRSTNREKNNDNRTTNA